MTKEHESCINRLGEGHATLPEEVPLGDGSNINITGAISSGGRFSNKICRIAVERQSPTINCIAPRHSEVNCPVVKYYAGVINSEKCIKLLIDEYGP